jgi:hypothetical protein
VEASDNTDAQLEAALQAALEWLVAAADREFETESVLAAAVDAQRPGRLTVLVQTLSTALVTASRAERAMQELLGAVAERNNEDAPAIRFEHPAGLGEGWTVSPRSAQQLELIDAVEELRVELEGRQ